MSYYRSNYPTNYGPPPPPGQYGGYGGGGDQYGQAARYGGGYSYVAGLNQSGAVPGFTVSVVQQVSQGPLSMQMSTTDYIQMMMQEASIFPPILTSYFDIEAVAHLNSEAIMTKLAGLCTFEKNKNLHDATRNQYWNPLWHQHRNGRITGSKAHDIITRRPSTCPNNLVKRIMGYKSYDLSKISAVRWGLDHEHEARQRYIQNQIPLHRGFKCDLAGFQISNDKWFIGATADGLIQCECCGKGCLEIICPHKHKDILISEAIVTDSDFCLSPDYVLKRKHRYYTQIQCQMAVNQVEYCDLCVFTIPDIIIVRIARDANFISELFEKCSDFYIHFVLPELRTKTLQREISDSRTRI